MATRKSRSRRIVGTIPAGQLDILAHDLRLYPSSWFEPLISKEDLPNPIKSVNPIRVVEVLPGVDPLVDTNDPRGKGPSS